MSDYRRNRVPGATYFFTVNLYDRHSDLFVRQISELRNPVRDVRRRSSFQIAAWVVLPNHMDCLWTLPEGDSDFASRWRDIKTTFSKSLPRAERRSHVMVARRERGNLAARYSEHTIRDDRDYAVHFDYINFNPVKHGLVAGLLIGRFRASGAP